MILPINRNPLAELSYYVREMEEHDFINEPSISHIFIDALNAELLLNNELIINYEVAFSLLLLNDFESLNFNVVANDIILNSVDLEPLQLSNHPDFLDKNNWCNLFNILFDYLKLNENANYKIVNKNQENTEDENVYFVVNQIDDVRKDGSSLVPNQIYNGILLENNSIQFEDINGQVWSFYIDVDCNIVFSRKCDVTGEGMNKGWVIGDHSYFKYENDVLNALKDRCYSSIQEAYDDNYSVYYTEWDTANDAQYILVNNELVDFN